MTDFNGRNLGTGPASRLPERSTNTTLIYAALIVVILLAALAYAYSNSWFGMMSDTASHPATTAAAAPGAAPATPLPSVSPATTRKQ